MFQDKETQILTPEWTQWFYEIFIAIGGGATDAVLGSREINTATGLTGGGNLTQNRTIDYDLNSLTADASPNSATDYVLTYDASASSHKKVLLDDLPGATGETNTASNIGLAGVGPFDSKSGVDLQFKNIDSPNSTISVVDNGTNDTIELEAANGIREFTRIEVTGNNTTSATIPLDDTIPQNTEGTELTTLSITPKKSTNILRIEVNLPVIGADTNNTTFIGALFQDSTANALKATAISCPTAGDSYIFHMVHYMPAGTTSSTTFKFRYGCDANNVYINQVSGGGLFSTSTVSVLSITEIEP